MNIVSFLRLLSHGYCVIRNSLLYLSPCVMSIILLFWKPWNPHCIWQAWLFLRPDLQVENLSVGVGDMILTLPILLFTNCMAFELCILVWYTNIFLLDSAWNGATCFLSFPSCWRLSFRSIFLPFSLQLLCSPNIFLYCVYLKVKMVPLLQT